MFKKYKFRTFNNFKLSKHLIFDSKLTDDSKSLPIIMYASKVQYLEVQKLKFSEL
jgi:hypothetical protein